MKDKEMKNMTNKELLEELKEKISKNEPLIKIDSLCALAEIIVDVPQDYRIYQVAPINGKCLLIIFSNGRTTISHISSYIRARNYIFRRKEGDVMLQHDSEFYGC